MRYKPIEEEEEKKSFTLHPSSLTEGNTRILLRSGLPLSSSSLVLLTPVILAEGGDEGDTDTPFTMDFDSLMSVFDSSVESLFSSFFISTLPLV